MSFPTLLLASSLALPTWHKVGEYSKFTVGLTIGTVTELAAHNPDEPCLNDLASFAGDAFTLYYIYTDFELRTSVGHDNSMMLFYMAPYIYSLSEVFASSACRPNSEPRRDHDREVWIDENWDEGSEQFEPTEGENTRI